MDYIDPFADPALPDRFFLLVEQQLDSAAMDVSVDAEATGNQVNNAFFNAEMFYFWCDIGCV